MSDRFNMAAQIEHMQMKYTGTGHPDISKFEWINNQHRDSLASYVGHPHLINFFAVAHNASVGRQRFNMLQMMAEPCGPNPNKDA